MLTWKEKFINYIVRSWKLITAAGVVIILIIVLWLVYPWLNDQFSTKKVQTAVTPALSCGNLSANATTLEGTTPYAPKFTVNLDGSHLLNQPICQWYIDGAYSHSSFPLGDQCIFEKKNLILGGNYNVILKIVNSNNLIPNDSGSQVNANSQLTDSNVIVSGIANYKAVTCPGEKTIKVDSTIGKNSAPAAPGVVKETPDTEVKE
jgi:hypothetical protein